MAYTGDQKREYQRTWMKARRDAWIKENGPCAWCNSDENLQVDHINKYEKLYDPATLWSLALTNPKRVKELAKCQVLCDTCHSTKNELESLKEVHGNASTYRNGCRCDPCTNAQVLRIYAQRANKV